MQNNNMHLFLVVAKRNFTAMCKHKIRKGELYAVFNDYFAGTRYHQSKCQECQKNGKT